MTCYGLDDWFWAMFELTWTWPNFTFGQLFMWIGANNDQIWLPMGKMSDSEQCSNWLELDLISLLVNFSYELGQIMVRFDFIWPRWVNLNNAQTDSQLDLISILVNFSCELGQISGSFQKKEFKVGPKNLIRFYIALNLGEIFFFCDPKLSRYSKLQISAI